MKYTKNNGAIEYYIFLVSCIIVFFSIIFFKRFSSPYINELIFILVSFVLSITISYFKLFNLLSECFFKIPCLKKLVVNFNGKWEGKGKSSYNSEKSFGVTIEIKQTLTDISVNAFFDKSKSEAFSCHLLKENNKEKLIYNYFNYPDAIATAANLDKHYGTVILEKSGDNELQGNYFTDRETQTRGILKLKNTLKR